MKKSRLRGGATYDAFTPPPSSRQPFMAGPFNCVMAPTKRAISRKSYSDTLSLGLLSNTPDNDGEGGVELAAEGYSRQSIRLVRKNYKAFAVANSVTFNLCALPVIKCLAIFNTAGEIEAYGVPLASRTGPEPADLKFAAHAIIVRTIMENI